MKTIDSWDDVRDPQEPSTEFHRSGTLKRGRPPKEELTLNKRHRLFVSEYLANGLEGAAAYRTAFQRKSQKPLTKEVATAGAQRLLKRPDIQAYLSRVMASYHDRKQFEAEDVLLHLREALFLDPIDLFDSSNVDGVWEVKALEDIPPQVRKCITNIKSRTRIDPETGDQVQDLEIKLISKDKALDLAMKYFGLISQAGGMNVTVKGDNTSVTIDFDQLAQGRVVDATTVAGEEDPIEARINGAPSIVDASEDTSDRGDGSVNQSNAGQAPDMGNTP